MKLKKLFPLLLLLMGVFALTACGGDDDNDSPKKEDPAPPANDSNALVVGSYTGWTHLKTAFIDRNYSNDTFELKLSEDGSLTAVFTDATWGTATITGINASATTETKADFDDANGYFVLTGGEGKFVMNNPREGTTQEFPCKLEFGYVSADKQLLKAVISSYMEVGHGEMTFTFTTGAAPEPES